jgi:hypothetical protein
VEVKESGLVVLRSVSEYVMLLWWSFGESYKGCGLSEGWVLVGWSLILIKFWKKLAKNLLFRWLRTMELH